MKYYELPNGEWVSLPDKTSDEAAHEIIRNKYSHLFKKLPQEEAAQNKTTIPEDIAKSLDKTPTAIASFLAQMVPETLGAGKQLLLDSKRARNNLVLGLPGITIGGANAFINSMNYLKEKGVLKGEKTPNWGEQELEALRKKWQGEPQAGDVLLQSALPFGGATKAANLIPKIGNAGRLAAAGAAMSASQNQDPIQGAITNILIPKIAEGTPRIIKKAATAATEKYNILSEPWKINKEIEKILPEAKERAKTAQEELEEYTRKTTEQFAQTTPEAHRRKINENTKRIQALQEALNYKPEHINPETGEVTPVSEEDYFQAQNQANLSKERLEKIKELLEEQGHTEGKPSKFQGTINKKQRELEEAQKIATQEKKEIPEHEVPLHEAQTELTKVEDIISNDILKKGKAHDVEVTQDINQGMEARKQDIRDKTYNKAKEMLADRYTTHTDKLKNLQEKIKKILGKRYWEDEYIEGDRDILSQPENFQETIPQTTLIKMWKAVKSATGEVGRKAYKEGGSNQQYWQGAHEELLNLKDEIHQLVSDEVNPEAFELMKEGDKRWREEIVPVQEHRIYNQAKYKQEIQGKDILNGLRGGTKGAAILRDIVGSNPKTILNAFGHKYAKNPYGLLELSDLEKSFAEKVPIVQSAIRSLKANMGKVEAAKIKSAELKQQAEAAQKHNAEIEKATVLANEIQKIIKGKKEAKTTLKSAKDEYKQLHDKAQEFLKILKENKATQGTQTKQYNAQVKNLEAQFSEMAKKQQEKIKAQKEVDELIQENRERIKIEKELIRKRQNRNLTKAELERINKQDKVNKEKMDKNKARLKILGVVVGASISTSGAIKLMKAFLH